MVCIQIIHILFICVFCISFNWPPTTYMYLMGEKTMSQPTLPSNCYWELFNRYPQNPILTNKNWPYPANTVFNAAATMYKGQTLLLCRVEDRTGFSHLCKAVSADGVSNWQIDNKPTLARDPARKEELWGLEDPRITYLDELGRYAVAYTAYSACGPVVSLALTQDFETFERIGMVMPPEDKDAALFPHRINGKWYMVHRPIEHSAHIWISASKDLKYWGEHTIGLNARAGAWWDANKVGLSPPPLETEDGWLILYHGVRHTAAGAIYRLGFAMLDLENPTRVLRRSQNWVFAPKEPYEREGDVDDVVFPCGWILDKESGELRMYYGAADTCICLATASISDVMEYMRHCPEQDPEIVGCL